MGGTIKSAPKDIPGGECYVPQPLRDQPLRDISKEAGVWKDQICWGSAAMCGWRATMEDTHINEVI